MRLASCAVTLLLTARPPPPRLRACAADDEPFAGLVICTNTNICGKQNPTFAPGFGFASRAIECIRVLGPPGLQVNSGPCFIRCSAGVNAKLVLPEGTPSAEYNGCELRQGRPYYRLNSVGACVDWLHDELGLSPPADKLRAYDAYVQAIEVLETRGDDSPARRASQALPLLDVAAEHVLASEPVRWPAPASEPRRSWLGSMWLESFYESRLWLQPSGDEEAAAAMAAAEEEEEEVDVETFAGGSAAEAEAALAAASASLGRKKRRAPRKAAATGGDVCGGYGGPSVRGMVQGTASGDTLSGRWEEANGGPGVLTLKLSSNGLRFEGVARTDGKQAEEFAWSGTRVAPPLLASEGTAVERWHGSVLSMRARALLTLGKTADALDDAVNASRRCPWLPEAWEVLSDAALEAGLRDVAVMALEELLYLQPADAADQRGRSRWEARSAKSLAVPNQRRLQTFTLAKLRRADGAPLRKVTLSQQQQRTLGRVFAGHVFDEAGRATAIAASDAPAEALELDNSAKLDAQLDAIFANEYELPD